MKRIGKERNMSMALTLALQILLAKKTDYRADLFERAMKAGADIQEANRKVLLRMRL